MTVSLLQQLNRSEQRDMFPVGQTFLQGFPERTWNMFRQTVLSLQGRFKHSHMDFQTDETLKEKTALISWRTNGNSGYGVSHRLWPSHSPDPNSSTYGRFYSDVRQRSLPSSLS